MLNLLRFNAASVILVAIASAPSLAEPNKIQFELEERCGQAARGIFEKDWEGKSIVNTPNGQIIANFENHYNPVLNRCYYLLRSNSYLRVPPTTNVSLMLIDVNENREIGEFRQNQQDRPAWCFVANTTCHSKAEWQTLIKPYMER